MSDPAAAAVRRAYQIGEYECLHQMEAAAREALKPIQELHHKVPNGRYPKCSTCEYDWPCATAFLIYTSEELA